MISSSLQWVKVALKPIIIVAVVLCVASYGFGRADALRMTRSGVIEAGWGIGGALTLIAPFFESVKEGKTQGDSLATPRGDGPGEVADNSAPKATPTPKATPAPSAKASGKAEKKDGE